MSEIENTPNPEALAPAPDKVLPPAAQRALAEAAERRAAAQAVAMAEEKGGRDGPEPTRYGDWERKGVAVDF
ncbi:MAG: DUF1674 domain-containing protein [Alphaproteobacteria bacterium]|nr:DUF1674 domain-containing protein [Alphaproteobacteria bacterium]